MKAVDATNDYYFLINQMFNLYNAMTLNNFSLGELVTFRFKGPNINQNVPYFHLDVVFHWFTLSTLIK